MNRLVIDTDPGVDDAQAIMMALAYPEATVEALTTVSGNVSLAHTTANACTILDTLGCDIPVYAGCDAPLVLPITDAADVHGQDGLGDADLRRGTRQPEAEHAAQALVRLASEAPGELTLVAIGPLTNLAVALKLDPALPTKYRRLVVMGGAIHGRGNTENLSAEFNIYADPEAAHVVLHAWPHLSLCSWETTLAYPIDETTLARWRAMETTSARFFNRISRKTIAFIDRVLGRPILFGADALAMAVALEPQIVTRAETHAISVELHGRYTRGQTTVDWNDRSGRPANTEIVLELDAERFITLMEMGLQL